jgi:RNA polymerase sigma factor (sigma-70 family)
MSNDARQKLIADHMEMAAAIAADCASKYNLYSLLPYDDILAYARQGLVEAANRYSPGSGASFRTFSWTRIKGAIIDGVRKTGRYGYSGDEAQTDEERSQPIQVGEPTPLEIDGVTDEESLLDPPESRLDRKRLRMHLLTAIAALPARQREVTLRHYYLDEDIVAISRDKGLCHDYVGRVRARSLEQLRVSLGRVLSSYGSAEAVQ